jgi:hypothetical protein
MTNKTITLSRELVERAVMRPGKESLAVNNADIIARGRAQAEIRELLADPVPPAGGEPETIAYTTNGRTRVVLADQKDHAVWNAGRPLIYLEDHRAHVTRLQAEVHEFRTALQVANKNTKQVIAGRDALQSELTKARELLVCASSLMYAQKPSNMSSELINAICALFNQPSPVTKRPGDNKPLLPIGTVALFAKGHVGLEHLWSEHDRAWIGRTVKVLSLTPTWVGTVAVVQDVFNNEITAVVNDLLTPCDDWTSFKSADGKEGKYKVENGTVHCELQIDIRNDQSAPADKECGEPVDVEAAMLQAFSDHAKQFTFKNHPATPGMFPVGFPWFKAGYEIGRAEQSAPVAVVRP